MIASVVVECHRKIWTSLIGVDFLALDDHVYVHPDSKVHGANMRPIWGRQVPGGPCVGPMNFAIWVDCRYVVITTACGAASGDKVGITSQLSLLYDELIPPFPLTQYIRCGTHHRHHDVGRVRLHPGWVPCVPCPWEVHERQTSRVRQWTQPARLLAVQPRLGLGKDRALQCRHNGGHGVSNH